MKTDILKLRKFAAVSAALFASCILNANVATFEDVDIVTDPSAESGQGEALRFESGSGSNYWTSGEAYFNLYEGGGYWCGITASNSTNTSLSGLAGQYTSITGSGYDGSSNYGIVYYSQYDALMNDITADVLTPDLANFSSMYITNAVYTYDTLLNGNDFAKNSLQSYADQSQYAEFKITIKGIVKMGDEENYAEYTENSVEVILGNTYLNEDTGKWEVYILQDWELIDLTTLNETDGLYGLNFTVEGTDKSGGWDNWPTYFAMDNISYTAVPEPATFAMIFGTLAVALAAYKRRSNN